MRLLYAIDSLAPGGSERSLAALAPHYRDLGIDLTVVVLHDRDGLAEDLRDAGGEVVSLADATNRAARLRAMTGLVRTRRPDLVHTTLFESDVTGRVAGRVAGVPVVSSLVSESYGAAHLAEPGVRRSRLRAAQTLDALTARLATRLHAVSTPVRDLMAARLRYPAARIDVVPRGRDPEVLGRRTTERRRAARAGLGVTDADVVVLSAARHEPAKALDVLVAALASARAAVPGICLVIAGSEGGATASVRAVVDAHGLSSVVSLLGPRDDIADLLCAADVFALSSRREGMPGAVIEAAALEAPIVATDLPAVREITGLDGALLVAPDPASLADALVAVVRDPDAARQRAVQARTRFEAHFTTARTAGAMRDFYERALGREGPAGGSPARVATTT